MAIISTPEALRASCGILNRRWIMELSTSSQYLLVSIVLAGLATLWAVWPEKYVAWLRAMRRKMPTVMRMSIERVDAVFPFSSSKPWYPKLLRVIGILIWAMLLWFAYMVYRF